MLRNLTNGQVSLTVAPHHGFTITHLAGAGSDQNILWSPPQAHVRRLPQTDLGPSGEASAEYFDSRVLVGGWFPMFPTAGPPGQAADRWMHGELARIGWDVVAESPVHVTARVETPATAIDVERTVTLAKNTVLITTRARNLQDRPQNVTFGEHPCFDRAVFGGGALNTQPYRSRVTSQADADGSLLRTESDFDWPHAASNSAGLVDLSVIPGAADGRHAHVSLTGSTSLRLQGREHVVDLDWDVQTMPHALLWQHFNPQSSALDADVFAVEPMSYAGRTLDDAVASGALTTLEAGASITSWMSLTVARP